MTFKSSVRSNVAFVTIEPTDMKKGVPHDRETVQSARQAQRTRVSKCKDHGHLLKLSRLSNVALYGRFEGGATWRTLIGEDNRLTLMRTMTVYGAVPFFGKRWISEHLSLMSAIVA